MGFYMTVIDEGFGDRHAIVMLIVIGKMAFVRDFLPGMTVMTLMTAI